MIILVTAKPGSKKPGIEILPDGQLVVRVAARPVEGKANDAIVQALAAHFDIAPSHIRLVGGQKGKVKRFEIPNDACN
jgi:uncharacterized protein YggU (UPF0235/DUF167 family)